MIIPSFVLSPLIYLGVIFYSIKMLSDFLQNVSQINPVLYMINGFRHGILGQSDIKIEIAFTVIVIFIILFVFWSLILLNKDIVIKEWSFVQ